MIAADALTNPVTWRRCHHVYDDATATPRRCLACRAIDHGTTFVGHMLKGGRAGYRMGAFMYSVPEVDAPAVPSATCPKGHRWSVERHVVGGREVRRRTCWPCRNEAREARLLEPCPDGHVGQRFYPDRPKDRGIRCRECDAARKRRARAADITRRYAEQVHA